MQPIAYQTKKKPSSTTTFFGTSADLECRQVSHTAHQLMLRERKSLLVSSGGLLPLPILAKTRVYSLYVPRGLVGWLERLGGNQPIRQIDRSMYLVCLSIDYIDAYLHSFIHRLFSSRSIRPSILCLTTTTATADGKGQLDNRQEPAADTR